MHQYIELTFFLYTMMLELNVLLYKKRLHEYGICICYTGDMKEFVFTTQEIWY